MSCYIVDPGHINAMVQWAAEHGALPAGYTSQDTAQLLYAANVRSFNQRYKEAEPEAFTFEAPTTPAPTHAEAAYLIERLDYQCDNWHQWEDSAAQGLLNKWSKLALAGVTV